MKQVFNVGRFLRRALFRSPRFLAIDTSGGDRDPAYGVCVMADVLVMWWGVPLHRFMVVIALGVFKALILMIRPSRRLRVA